MARRKTDDSPIYQLKITLRDSKPPIWRRVQVPGDMTLEELHVVIQIAMGWLNSHLHQFVVGGVYYADPDMDWGEELEDETRVRLRDIAHQEKDRFVYEYDFGDGWDHTVLVEKLLPPDPAVHYPYCVTGRRACPPEDVGGMWGYYHFLEAINDPNHPDHDMFMEWHGEPVDPAHLDLDEINGTLRHVFR
jgi:hypothetical protein